MSQPVEHSSRRERGIIYVIAIVILVILGIIGVISFSTARQDAAANEKAEQLVQSLEDAGLTPPSTDQIARVLGNDGGTVCQDPNGALTKALVLGELVTGSGSPGQRPVIVEDRVLTSQLLIIEVYCPEELEEYRDFIDELETVTGS